MLSEPEVGVVELVPLPELRVTNFQLTFLIGLPVAEPPSCLKLARVRPRFSLDGMPGGLRRSCQPAWLGKWITRTRTRCR